MQSKSKRKGKSLEDRVASMIRKKFNVDKKYIQRADASGNKSTEIGDINIFDKEVEKKFPFVIECKNREEWQLRDIIGYSKNNKSNPFKKYIEQNKVDLAKAGGEKYGLIVFSKAYEDIYAMMYQPELFEDLDLSVLDQYIVSNIQEYKVLITRFENILNNYKIFLRGNFSGKSTKFG